MPIILPKTPKEVALHGNMITTKQLCSSLSESNSIEKMLTSG